MTRATVKPRPRGAATRRIVYRPRRYDIGGLADPFDATVTLDPGSTPEPVFDRVSGPFARAQPGARGPHPYDEEP